MFSDIKSATTKPLGNHREKLITKIFTSNFFLGEDNIFFVFIITQHFESLYLLLTITPISSQNVD